MPEHDTGTSRRFFGSRRKQWLDTAIIKTSLLDMSDTRNDAEQEMVNAGIATGLEDSLGVS